MRHSEGSDQRKPFALFCQEIESVGNTNIDQSRQFTTDQSAVIVRIYSRDDRIQIDAFRIRIHDHQRTSQKRNRECESESSSAQIQDLSSFWQVVGDYEIDEGFDMSGQVLDPVTGMGGEPALW